MTWTVEAICAGRAVKFRESEKSAIAKQVVDGPVRVATLGLVGDEQADLVNHGGPDMALHLYPLDHHDYWREELGDHPLLDTPGGFGSNLAVAGLREDDICLGDRLRLGNALIEACQPRKPCWKIEHRFGEKKMVKRILRTGRCGIYFRVIEEGEVSAGSPLTVERHGNKDWSIARIFGAVWGTAEKRDPFLLREVAELPLLADRMKAKVREMAAALA